MLVSRQPAGSGALPFDTRDQIEVASDRGRVLVVEDNPIDQYAAAALLESLDYVVCLADNGCDAVAAAANAHFDLILIDCEMPVMDGYAATASIRAAEGTDRHTPIVALTALSTQQVRERCLDVGMDDHLTKPLRREELTAILTRFHCFDPGCDLLPISAGAEPRADTAASIAERLDELFEGIGGDTAADRIELLESFLSRVALEMDQIDDAVAVNDTDALCSRAHSVKGMAGNVGASRVADAAAVVEDAARDGQLERVPRAAAILRRAVADADDHIRGMVAVLASAR